MRPMNAQSVAFELQAIARTPKRGATGHSGRGTVARAQNGSLANGRVE